MWDDASHVTSPAARNPGTGSARIWFIWAPPSSIIRSCTAHSGRSIALWGGAMLGYHLTNVFLHAVSACLVVSIVRRLALPGAWLAGLVFALHPVCVEAVAWISEQKSTLSGVFYLGAALVYLRFDQTRRSRHYLCALALFVLALLSKTVTATLPAALLIVFWWQRGTAGLPARRSSAACVVRAGSGARGCSRPGWSAYTSARRARISRFRRPTRFCWRAV